jgi:hypothetical protein
MASNSNDKSKEFNLLCGVVNLENRIVALNKLLTHRTKIAKQLREMSIQISNEYKSISKFLYFIK